MGTIDEYLAGLSAEDAAAIDRVYRIARHLVPEAEQGTGYGMPALTYRGRPLLSLKRTARHIGLYPFSPEAVAATIAVHAGLDHDKGTIRFQPDAPLPDPAVRLVVTTRREQIDRSGPARRR